ncbi:uncharacterized protein LOC133793997 [Humulus lupulus]|uniref:uncharacterized protein LOC133793997 n=1 Tax=Humulus lupulus TaxID=3486 RepID=UPI002B412045|nr:uncharacterized protein LOC133793997 [Humulus lupulus]
MTTLTLASPTASPRNKQSTALPQVQPLPPPHCSLLENSSHTLRPVQPFGPSGFSQVSLPSLPPQPRNHFKKSRIQRSTKKTAMGVGKNELIAPPFPWATTQPATIHSMKYLVENNIVMIEGEVECKRCDRRFPMVFDLLSKYQRLESFIAEEKSVMNDRAPACWLNPNLPTCSVCNEAVRPVIASRNEEINWLFLLLGQLLGCCKLNQLKYFCMQSENHRTGAKDRVLYLTYLGLCNQLVPKPLYDPHSR